MKIYVTFGQSHTHSIAGKTLDKDCVAVIECKDMKEGRDQAFTLFGPKFFTTYPEERIDAEFMSYFPRGLMEV